MFKNLTIKAKIIAYVCFIIFVVTLSVTFTWTSQMRQILHSQTEERLHSNGEMVALILGAFKTHTFGLLDVIATLPQLSDVLQGGGSVDMNIILQRLHEGMQTESRYVLYDNFIIFNAALEPVAAAHPGTPDTSYIREHFCYTQTAPGQIWVSDVNQDMGWMQLWYALPIMEGDIFMGLAAISVNTRAIDILLRLDYTREHTYFIYITDTAGTILFSNVIAYIGRHANDLGMSKPFEYMPAYTMLAHTSAITGLDQMAYLSIDSRSGWSIISFFYAHEMENIAEVIFISLIPFAVGIILAAAILIIMLTKALNPLKSLAVVSAQIAGGNTDVDFTINNNDEISQVSRSFIELIKQMQLAKMEAESASNAKSIFLSSMSHEIRTPMNAIIGMTHIAQNTDNLPRIKDSLNKIDKASNHLLGILNRILDMSKIEANQFELFPHSFEFRKMMRGVTDVLSVLAMEKGLQINMDLDADIPPYIVADELQLAQVVTNILSNAIKFSYENGTINLRAQRLTEEGTEMLRIDISDTGIGIAKTEQSSLFDMFEQVSANTERRSDGTGLGLAISKHIVAMAGGRMWVDSELGVGSTFSFSLPLIVGVEPKLPAQPQAINSFKGRTILIVEDIEINREIIMAMLEPTEIQMECAENGAAAVEMFIGAPDRYDIIFMDIQMPEMDGVTATRLIRGLDVPQAKRVPILAMTANVFQEDIDTYIAVGMNDHLGKPLEMEVVLRKLGEYCSANYSSD